MKEDEYIVPSGPLKGKSIELASTTGVEIFEEIAKDFMQRVFDLAEGDYLITDESSLFDFTVADDLNDVHRKIEQGFNVNVSDLKSARLLEIFIRLHETKRTRK